MANWLEIHDGIKAYKINGGLLPMPPDLRKALGMCENWVREVNGEKALPVGYVSRKLREELMNRLIDLQETLAGGPADEVAKEVMNLLQSFPGSGGDTDKTVEKVKIYTDILQELPAWSVASVVRKFTIGDAGKGEFAPSPAQVYQIAQQNLVFNKDEWRRIKAIVDMPTNPAIEGPWWTKVPKEDRDRVELEREGLPNSQGIGKDGKTAAQRAEVADRLVRQWNESRAAPKDDPQSLAAAARKAARQAWEAKEAEKVRVNNLRAKGHDPDAPENLMVTAEFLQWQADDKRLKALEAAEEAKPEEPEEEIPF